MCYQCIFSSIRVIQKPLNKYYLIQFSQAYKINYQWDNNHNPNTRASVATPMNQLNQERKEWTRKEPLEKTRPAYIMNKLLTQRKTRGSSPKNKKCKFKRLKIDRQLRSHVINTNSSWTAWWTKIFGWKNSWPDPDTAPSVPRRSCPKQKTPQTPSWWLIRTTSILTPSFKTRTIKNLRNLNPLL